jgi:amino acid adenylation domain-containing protein
MRPNEEPAVSRQATRLTYRPVELRDLFVPATTTAASTLPAELRGSIPADVAQALVATASAALPDTICLAAWLWVLACFQGLETVPLAEPDGVSRDFSVPREASVSRWLQQLEAERRGAGQCADAASSHSRWLGLGAFDGDALACDERMPITVGVQLGATPELRLAFAPSVLCEAEAQSLLTAWLCALRQMAHGPDARLDDIGVLDAPAWLGDGVFSSDRLKTVHAVFAERAAERGEAIALRFKGVQLSYRELNSRAEALATRLATLGVKPGDVVCVALPRSLESIVVLLGILKAGAAYLPVDAAQPAQRTAFLLQEAQAALVVARSAQRAVFAAAVRWLAVESLDDVPAATGAFSPVLANGDSTAYVMYTSGSTGTPKGVAITHDAILRLVIGAGYVELSPQHTMLHAAPLGFDASTLEIWGPLLNGGRCVLHGEDLPTAAGLAATIRGESVTTAWLTSALFNSVVDDDPAHLRGLHQLLVGGEALSVPHIRRALAALPDTTLINGYGPTECTTFTCTFPIPRELADDARSIPIGRPITDTRCRVLSPSMQPLPVGLVGELYVGGRGLAKGYLGRPDLTDERFVPDPFLPGERLYRTGDLVRCRADGVVEFIGRADTQVKLRGYRIELGEIEIALAAHPALKRCAVQALPDAAGGNRLVAYLVAAGAQAPVAELRAHLAARLPDFMLPSAWVWLDQLPITSNGKLDRRALPAPASDRPDLSVPYRAPANDTERALCEAFAGVLGLDRVGRADNFFELGGNSLLAIKALQRLHRDASLQVSTTTFFRHPTAEAIAHELAGGASGLDTRRLSRRRAASSTGAEPIAIIAMAARLPGARDVEQFWQNLCEGRDSITFFNAAQLDPSLPPALTQDPAYVRARGVIDDVEMFDAGFFGISPRDADLMDPQQRIFLELSWECLERGGHAPDATQGPVGVFAGMYNATYFQRHLQQRPDLIDKVGAFQVMLNNEKDYIATRVANRLNLTGPAVSVHTACSTSLVAIAQAFTSLRAGQCDMALAGGVAVTCPPNSGYLYQEGSMLSPDGRTRSFDAQASGTVFSDGAAVVLLKRLSDALADGDDVIAVVRDVAINNDGRDKASFTAASVDGQAAVVAAAHAAAGIDPRSISYVETHGTATPMGDPVEIEALTRAFRRATDDVGFCRIGSAKSNIGHTVIAAGAAGVIKTALALREERLPASLHFSAPNPKIDFASSPFTVNAEMTAWPRAQAPRRAGVSGFGVGGTNAHAVLEEAPERAASSPATGPQLLQLSARSREALDTMALRLADHLLADPALNLADVAHTLQVGRSQFDHRLSVVAGSVAEAALALRSGEAPRRKLGAAAPALVWLFPGQGAQYAGMGRGLYANDPAFRAAFDECAAHLNTVLPFDLRQLVFEGTAQMLQATSVTQPATFCIEYALAQSWLARGVRPAALIGHSVGEFVAAVLAGVMSLRDAAVLVARRGALMQALPAGSMLSVRMPAAELRARLPDGLSLAAENGPSACVVAGPGHEIETWRLALEADGIACRPLQTSHAFHSSMMDAAVAPFEAEVRAVALQAPALPIISSLTGQPMRAEDATDPRYWARHLRETVRFSPAIRLAQQTHMNAVFLEVGPRASLSTLVRQHGQTISVASLADTPEAETVQMLQAQGQLWTLGLRPLAPAASPAEGRRRVRLPTYPFERKRHWVEAAPHQAPAVAAAVVASVPEPLPAPQTLPQISTMAPSPVSSPASSRSESRRPRLVAQLRTVFEDVAGMDLDTSDPSINFMELGLDSLTLTQAALQVKKQFGVAVTFRQLMEQQRSFAALAEWLDEALPAEATAAAPVAAPAAAAIVSAAPALAAVALPVAPVFALSAGADGGLVQQVIQQQMQLMAQQLALLGANPQAAQPAAQAVSIAPAVASAPAVQAAALPEATRAKAAEPDAAGAPIRYDVKKAFGAIARIHTQAQEISPRQRARLDAFMRRYAERTAQSKAYTVEHRPHLADPRVVNGFRPVTKEITYQIVVNRSKGSKVWDIDGHEYVDTLNGFGMNLFGWQPDFITEAVHRQVDAGYEIGPQHPLAGEVAKLICELSGFDRAGLCNTGSEAVMAAVRIARTVTGRNIVVLFTGSYHGTFDEVLVRSGRGGKGIPAAPGILPGVFGDVRVLDYGTPEALQFIRDNADDLAAVLVEPVQSRRPDFQPKDFLKEVREITQRSGTCLIFDEVITGFRAHLGGAQAVFGVRADLACYGKVIGGGFPVGVVAGKREFMDALDGGAWQYGDASVPTVGVTYFAGTFVRHPLALAAAKAALEHLKQRGPELQVQLNLHTAAMADELSAFCRELGAPLEIRYFASLWRVHWLEDHPLQDLLFAMMRNRGVHILDNFPCFLTTAHTPQDIATIKTAFKESVAELKESEFLPCRTPAGSPVLADASQPPVPHAKLGRDRDGTPIWFVPDPAAPGKYKKFIA